ncbi:MAG: hypothetical protein CMO20_01075 [Thermoplasmata archaeon]|nr:hypothetical protein [Thermoplasmata archaeon]
MVAPLTAEASASGHITLLFSIQDSSPQLLEQGSRGVGLCIDADQPTCKVVVQGYKKRENIKNYQELTELHKAVISEISVINSDVLNYYWQIQQQCSLPHQQGFGLSASGALASAFAIQKALGLELAISYQRSFHIAHLVERKLSGGLGDVAALLAGGVDIRIEPGCPELSDGFGAQGKVNSWKKNFPMLVAWRNKKTRHTSSYIDNPEWKSKIRECGEKQMNRLSKGDWGSFRWSEILNASSLFSIDSGLATDANRAELLDISNAAITELDVNAIPQLCMLGESVVVLPNNLDDLVSIGDLEQISEYLYSYQLESKIVYLSNETLR